jgi:Cyclopropane fatty acid synthase and related methyltransferases
MKFAANGDLIARAARRVRNSMRSARIRSGVALLDGSDFEYWGRKGDDWHGERLDVPLNELWIDRGFRQFEFLKSVGLLPSHRLLDYGCAHLATARWLVPYLSPGNYVGMDVSRLVAARGVDRLSTLGIQRNRYHLLHAHDESLDELRGFEFDFIFEFSVFQYMSKRQFRAVMPVLTRSLAQSGVICLTISTSENEKAVTDKGMHHHTLEAVRELLPSPDFSLEVIEGRFDAPIGVFRRAP